MDRTEHLVAGLKAGHQEAQAALWQDHFDEVYAICARIIGTGTTATDTAVDVLADFSATYVHGLQHAGALSAYLRQMAIRRSVHQRALQDGRETPLAEVDNQPSPNEQALDETVAYAALVPRLDGCLAELSTKSQRVLRMRFHLEMPNEQIGALVGGSKQYIGRLIRSSLGALRRCLERQGSRSAPYQSPRHGNG